MDVDESSRHAAGPGARTGSRAAPAQSASRQSAPTKRQSIKVSAARHPPPSPERPRTRGARTCRITRHTTSAPARPASLLGCHAVTPHATVRTEVERGMRNLLRRGASEAAAEPEPAAGPHLRQTSECTPTLRRESDPYHLSHAVDHAAGARAARGMARTTQYRLSLQLSCAQRTQRGPRVRSSPSEGSWEASRSVPHAVSLGSRTHHAPNNALPTEHSTAHPHHDDGLAAASSNVS